MKLQVLCTMVTTLALGVNAMSSNMAGAQGHYHHHLLHEFHRHRDPVPDHDVGPMLKSAESMLMNLANRHADAPLADLVEEIRPFISQMQDSIKTAHSVAQQTLDNFDNDFSGCNTAKQSGEAQAASLENTKIGHSDDHKACRTLQKDADDQHQTCQSNLDTHQEAKDSSCQLYADAEGSPGCGGVPPNPGESWKSYIIRAADWFAKERDSYIRKEEKCNNDTAKLQQETTICLGSDGSGGQKKALEEKMQQCDAIQSQLESATCSYVSKVYDTCESFAACTTTVADGYDAQVKGIQTLETQRKVEWNATERLLCMLGAYNADGSANATKLQTCQLIGDNTSHLNLVYPTPVQRPGPCPALLPHPCGDDYISQEYGAGLDAPAATCTACAWANQPANQPAGSSRARYWRLTVTAGGTYGTGPDVDGHYCFGGYGPYGFAIYDGSSNRILPSAVECTECRGSYGDSKLLGSFTTGQHWCVWSPQNNGRSVLTITFAQEVSPAEYKFDCGGSSNCATSWTIEQSMDGTSWAVIETQTNRPPNTEQEYVLDFSQPGSQPGVPATPCVEVSRTGDDIQWTLIWRYSGGSNPISVWRPQLEGSCSLGDIAIKADVTSIPAGTAASFVSNGVGVSPTDFTWKVAENQASGINYWDPICPAGHISLGHVAVQAPETTTNVKPPLTSVCCVPEKIGTTHRNSAGTQERLWSDGGTGGMDNSLHLRKDLQTFIADGSNCGGRFSPPCTDYFAGPVAPVANCNANSAQTASAQAQVSAVWIKGGNGETCDTACSKQNKQCDSAKMSTIKSEALIRQAFEDAGYTCMSVGGHRSYPGTPFSTGRSGDDCYYLSDGASAVCDGRSYGHHSGLCACV